MKGRGALLITGALFALHPNTCVHAAAPTDLLRRLPPDVVGIMQELGHGQTGWDGLTQVDRSTRATMQMNGWTPVERVLQLIEAGNWRSDWDAVPAAAQMDPRVVEAALAAGVLSMNLVREHPRIAAAFRTWDSLPASFRGDSEIVKSILMAHLDNGPLNGLRESFVEQLAEDEGGNEHDADHAGTRTASRISNKWEALVAAPAVEDTNVLFSAIMYGALRTWSALPLTAKKNTFCVLAAIKADLLTPEIAAAGGWQRWVQTIGRAREFQRPQFLPLLDAPNVVGEGVHEQPEPQGGAAVFRRWETRWDQVIEVLFTLDDPLVVMVALRRGLIRQWSEVPTQLRLQDPPNRRLVEEGARRILEEQGALAGPLFGEIGEVRWMLAGQVEGLLATNRLRQEEEDEENPNGQTVDRPLVFRTFNVLHGSSRSASHNPPALMAFGVLTSAGELDVVLQGGTADEASHRALVNRWIHDYCTQRQIPFEFADLQLSEIREEDEVPWVE